MSKTKEEIERKIKLRSLDQRPQGFFLKGQALIELSDITDQATQDYTHCLEQAIEAFSEAIKKDVNAKYLCERAQTYLKLGRNKDALQDFQDATQIPEGKDSLSNQHVQNLLQDLSQLQSIKLTITELEAEGTLPQKFLDSYKDLVCTVENLSMAVIANTQDIQELKAWKAEVDFALEQKDNEISQLKAELEAKGNNDQALQLQIDSLEKVQKVLTKNLSSMIEKQKMNDFSAKKQTVQTHIMIRSEYDNKLLNNPKLLKKSIDQYGVDKVIHLSSKLSPFLVEEAMREDDDMLILAGVMSLFTIYTDVL